ncbi:hypothetical protein [Ruegeria sp. THAF33]|uniref:hypothetical protein n=1 Tax=Ruegeria sp. THAF33 TaxID=2587853 RepID=UPI0012681A70|nr:hypothetical protein [Ruegeria sp. THAF33]QFT71800.1 hypothetical protein FIU92_02065 [Ruegeria sp. THAF33]
MDDFYAARSRLIPPLPWSTFSPPFSGDMVVKNRCEATGNEEILVKADKFATRYQGPLHGTTSKDWAEYRPIGKKMEFFIVPTNQAPFSFVAPWGETMPPCPGEAIVQDPIDTSDTYRIARDAFNCTYTVLVPNRE